MKPIDPQVIADAESALDRYIAGQRKRGGTVEVEEPLYHEGLTNVRCVLEIDGVPIRMYFRQSLGRWVKANSIWGERVDSAHRPIATNTKLYVRPHR